MYCFIDETESELCGEVIGVEISTGYRPDIDSDKPGEERYIILLIYGIYSLIVWAVSDDRMGKSTS